MPRIKTPPGIQLPACRIEPELHEALAAIAQEEGRTLSDVVRSFLRDKEELPSNLRLPPVRVEPALVRDLFNLANQQGRTVSDVMRSRLRARVRQRGAAQ